MKISEWYCCECRDIGGDECYEVFSINAMDIRENLEKEFKTQICAVACKFVPVDPIYLGHYHSTRFYEVTDENAVDKEKRDTRDC